MDKADVYWGIPYPGYGVWHCLLHQFYSHLLSCFKSHSFWNNGKLLEFYFKLKQNTIIPDGRGCIAELAREM